MDTVDGFKDEWLGWGCAAMFKCSTNEAYAEGMTGQQILNAFTYLYAEDDVGVCGSLYMANGTTWPPPPESDSKGGGGRQLDKRNAQD